MIDNLISSDFTALAREHRRVPSLDAVMPRDRAKVVRAPWKLDRWIARAMVGGSAVIAVRSDWFDHHPQSAPLIVVSIISLLGLFDTGAARDSFVRQLGAILGAIALLATSTTMILLDHSTSNTLSIRYAGAELWRGPEDLTGPGAVVLISVLAITGGYVLAAVLSLRFKPRALQPWSSLAKVVSTSVFVTWIGICNFAHRGTTSWTSFSPPRIAPMWERLQVQISSAMNRALWHFDIDKRLHERLTDTEFYFLLSAAGVALLVASIALAYRSKSVLAARWLSILEHVVVAPLGVAIGMLNLVLYLTVHMHQGPDDGAGYGALAVAGVLVAFTSMMLRRLRRSMIASR